MANTGGDPKILSIRRRPFLYGGIVIIAVIALVLQPFVPVVPGFLTEPFRGDADEVDLFYAAPGPIEAHELAFSADSLHILSHAYLADSVDLDALEAELAAGDELELGVVTSPQWQFEGVANQAREMADGQHLIFTMRTPEHGAGVGILDQVDGSLTFWPIPEASETRVLDELEDDIVVMSSDPYQLHRVDLDAAEVTTSSPVSEPSVDDAPPFPDPEFDVWSFDVEEGEAGGVMHPRIYPNGEIFYGSSHGGIGALDPNTGDGRFWNMVDPLEEILNDDDLTVNGLAIDQRGMVYGAVTTSVFGQPFGEGLIRLDPDTNELIFWEESDIGDFQHLTSSGDTIFTTARRGITQMAIDEPSEVVRWPVRRTNDIYVGEDGSLYFSTSDSVGVLDPASGQLTEWPLESGDLIGIYVDETAGEIYFGDRRFGNRRVGRIDTDSNRLTTWDTAGGRPLHVKIGLDGNLYYVDQNSSELGVIDPRQPGESRSIEPEIETVSAEESEASPVQLPALTPLTHTAQRSREEFEVETENGLSLLQLPGSPHDLTLEGGYVGVDMGFIRLDVLDVAPGARTGVAASAGDVVFHTHDTVGLIGSDTDDYRTWRFGNVVESFGAVYDIGVGDDGDIYAAVDHSIIQITPDDAGSEASIWPVAAPGSGEIGRIERLAIDDEGQVWFASPSSETVGVLDVEASEVRYLEQTYRAANIDVSYDLLIIQHADGEFSFLPHDDWLGDLMSDAQQLQPDRIPQLPEERFSPDETREDLDRVDLTARTTEATSDVRMDAGIRINPRDQSENPEMLNGLLASENAVVRLPLLTSLDSVVPAVREFNLSDRGVARVLAESRVALEEQIDQAMAHDISLVDRSWEAFTAREPFSATRGPDDERHHVLFGEDEKNLFTLFEAAGLVEAQDLTLPGHEQRLEPPNENLSEAHLALTDGLLDEDSEGAQLILEMLAPVVLSHLAALEDDPGYPEFEEGFRSSVEEIREQVSTRYSGDELLWALQDAAFEFMLNLQRLGANDLLLEGLTEATASAKTITSDYLGSVDDPVSPLARLSAHLGTRHDRQPYETRLGTALNEMQAHVRQLLKDGLDAVEATRTELGDAGDIQEDDDQVEQVRAAEAELETIEQALRESIDDLDLRSESNSAWASNHALACGHHEPLEQLESTFADMVGLSDKILGISDVSDLEGIISDLMGPARAELLGPFNDLVSAMESLQGSMTKIGSGRLMPNIGAPGAAARLPFGGFMSGRQIAQAFGLDAGWSFAFGVAGAAICAPGVGGIACLTLIVSAEYIKITAALMTINTSLEAFGDLEQLVEGAMATGCD